VVGHPVELVLDLDEVGPIPNHDVDERLSSDLFLREVLRTAPLRRFFVRVAAVVLESDCPIEWRRFVGARTPVETP
jgi:hypothetical protein